MIITIDGPSGTGKSTVARLLARKLGFSFFDTGALYRSLAWWVLQEKIDLSLLKDRLASFLFTLREEGEEKRYFVGNVEVTGFIRTKEITALSSNIATMREVRQALLPLQREYALSHDVVFEGRDLGSVVFPEAEVKIFLTAAPRVRAERRFKEMKQKDPSFALNQEEILQALQDRDEQDASREVAPLVCPQGAFVLDTSDLTQDEVVESLFKVVGERRKRAGLANSFK